MPDNVFGPTIIIDFDPASKQLLWQLSETTGSLRNFKRFWTSPEHNPARLIKRDIKINIMQGIDPDLKTWPLLSPTYAQIVRRPRMELGPTAIIAYADFAKTDIEQGFFAMYPNYEKMAGHEHYEALRRGWGPFSVGGAAPPREWFGMHPWTANEISVDLANYVDSRINEAISAAKVNILRW